jgi:hypothetical protein
LLESHQPRFDWPVDYSSIMLKFATADDDSNRETQLMISIVDDGANSPAASSP